MVDRSSPEIAEVAARIAEEWIVADRGVPEVHIIAERIERQNKVAREIAEALRARLEVPQCSAGSESAVKQLGARLADLLDADHWNNIEPLLLKIEAQAVVGPNVQIAEFEDNSGNEPAWHKVQDQIDAWAQQTLEPEHASTIMCWSDRLAQHLAPAQTKPDTSVVLTEALRNCGCPSNRRGTVGDCQDAGTCGCSLPSTKCGGGK